MKNIFESICDNCVGDGVTNIYCVVVSDDVSPTGKIYVQARYYEIRDDGSIVFHEGKSRYPLALASGWWKIVFIFSPQDQCAEGISTKRADVYIPDQTTQKQSNEIR